MDWDSVFDEAVRRPGLSDADLDRFVVEVGLPLSDVEIARANAGQSNPFRPGDAYHSSWVPFDAAKWVVPARPMPPSYLSFLQWSDGGSAQTGERYFQFFPARAAPNNVRGMLLCYNVPEYMPGALPFAFNGAGTFYLFDMRSPAVAGEYPVVCAHASYKRWDPEACTVVAASFVDACRGTANVDHLRERERRTRLGN